MSSEKEDTKEDKVLLASDSWSHSQSALSGLSTFHRRNEAPDCAWRGEGVSEVKRGRQDRVGGDKLLIIDSMVEKLCCEFS